MNNRAGRLTTDAERDLFYEAFADAKPLKPVAKPARARKAPPVVKPPAIKAAKPKPAAKAKTKFDKAKFDEPPEIGGHRATQVRKGRIDPDARLDLHGQTQESAHRALVRFLERSRAGGARVVLVIPGKSGVLNKQFKRWLVQGELAHLVSGVSAAHKRHGGSGAFYVLLRRAAPR